MAACRNGGARAAPTESRRAARSPRPASFVADFRADRVRGIGDVKRIVRQGGGEALILDARAKGRFDGTAPEPRPGLPSGHMPGAANLPYNELLNPDGTMQDPAALRARFAAAGVDGGAAGRHLLRHRRHRLHPGARPGARRLARSRPSMTAPGPNGPAGPKPRRRPPDARRRHPGAKTPPTPQHGFATRMSHAGRAGHARAWLRQPGGASRLHRAVSRTARRGSDAREAPLRAVHDLRHPGRADALRAGGRDRRDRGRHALR